MKKHAEATTLEATIFSIGNIANNLIFMLITMFMMFFFTNVMGIDPIIAGTIFMVARLVDAFTDPIMGIIIDRANFKHFGKYRGFIHFGAPLLGVVTVALFTVPNFNMGGKIIYAYIMYIMYSLCWTVVQVPQLTIPIILSNDITKRTKFQAIFQGIGSIGTAAASALAMAVVKANGGMTDPGAWQKTAITFAVIATIGFEISTLAVRKLDTYDPNAKVKAKAENGARPEQGNKLPLKERMAFIFKNVALFALLISFSTDMFANQINAQTNTYFWMNNMGGRTDLMSTLSALSMPVSIAMIFLAGPIVAKFSKKNAILACEIVGIAASLLMLFGVKSIPLVMISSVLGTISYAVCNLMCRTALLDVASYTRVKTGVDAAGLMASTFTFMNKLCQAIASFVAGWLLELIAFDKTAEIQTQATMDKLLWMRCIIPILAYVATLIAMHFYPLDKRGEAELQVALNALESAEAAEHTNAE